MSDETGIIERWNLSPGEAERITIPRHDPNYLFGCMPAAAEEDFLEYLPGVINS